MVGILQLRKIELDVQVGAKVEEEKPKSFWKRLFGLAPARSRHSKGIEIPEPSSGVGVGKVVRCRRFEVPGVEVAEEDVSLSGCVERSGVREDGAEHHLVERRERLDGKERQRTLHDGLRRWNHGDSRRERVDLDGEIEQCLAAHRPRELDESAYRSKVHGCVCTILTVEPPREPARTVHERKILSNDSLYRPLRFGDRAPRHVEGHVGRMAVEQLLGFERWKWAQDVDEEIRLDEDVLHRMPPAMARRTRDPAAAGTTSVSSGADQASCGTLSRQFLTRALSQRSRRCSMGAAVVSRRRAVSSLLGSTSIEEASSDENVSCRIKHCSSSSTRPLLQPRPNMAVRTSLSTVSSILGQSSTSSEGRVSPGGVRRYRRRGVVTEGSGTMGTP